MLLNTKTRNGEKINLFSIVLSLIPGVIEIEKIYFKTGFYDERSFVKYYVKKIKSNFLFYFQTLFADD